LTARDFAVAARLGLATTVLMFGLMVVGSLVRTTGSGLACPDWPLCHGHLIPPLEPHVLIEWFHRLLALVVGVGLLATVGFTWSRRALRWHVGGLAALAVTLYVMQALLGALTVWKLLSPAMVSSHLGVGMLLFGTLLLFTLVADEAAAPAESHAPRAPGALPLLALTTLLAWGQSLMGGIVSSSGAGAVCSDWPTCNGAWLPPMQGLIGLHMMHRLGGYLLALAVIACAARTRAMAAPVRDAAAAAVALVLAQVALGVLNVLLGVPPWVTTLHIANAILLFATLVATTFRAALLPVRASTLQPVTS
jgi:heme a synthase